MDVNKVLELIKEGENERVEFKRSFTSNIGEEIVAFANANGGYILIGVDNQGKIVGCDKESVKEKITGIIMNIVPRLNVKIHDVNIGGKDIVIIEVPKSREVVTIGDIAYIRIGRGKKVLSLQEIFWKKIENLEVNWDLLPSPATIDHLNEEKFLKFLEIRKEKRNIPYVGNIMEDLKKSKAIIKKNGETYLRNGAVLFFVDDPQEFYPQAKIRYAEFSSDMELIHEKEFRGDALKMINESYEYVISRLGKVSYRVSVRREYLLEYPEKAIREAIINAVAHRNYGLYADIRIMKYPDKLVIRSPGSLVPGVDLNSPDHIPRNPLICEYLFGAGFIERYGIGIGIIKKECEKHPFVELEFKNGPLHFDVIFKKSYGMLDDIDRMIIQYKNEGLSIREIAKRIKMSKSSVYKRLRKLREMGFLE